MTASGNEYGQFSKRLPPLPPVAIPWVAIVAGIFMIVTALIENAQLRGYPEGAPLHHDLTRPVLAFELPHDRRDIQVTLAPPVPVSQGTSISDMFYHSLYADFLFILSYATFFLLSLRMLPWTKRLWWLALAAALFDVAENVLLIRILDTPLNSITDATAATERVVSLTKWAFIALILMAIGWALTKVELKPFARPGTGMLAIVTLLAGIIGLTGIVPEFPWPAGWFTNRHIELMTMLSAVYPLVVVGAGLYGKWRSAPDSSGTRKGSPDVAPA